MPGASWRRLSVLAARMISDVERDCSRCGTPLGANSAAQCGLAAVPSEGQTGSAAHSLPSTAGVG